jgi:DNA-binding response OmpR family regulator
MPRVLVIDDDEVFAKLMVLALKQRGHDVECALDGDAGYRLFKASAFDAVVCDIVMPEKEGIETIQAIRRDRPEVAIVAISGGLQFGHHADMNLLEVVEKLGADITVKKPFQMPVLCKAVEDALRSHIKPAAGARA